MTNDDYEAMAAAELAYPSNAELFGDLAHTEIMERELTRADHNYRHGIREGERRMLWNVACGAECAGCHDGLSTMLGMAYSMLTMGALRALAASGDEDASRVLGERGW